APVVREHEPPTPRRLGDARALPRQVSSHGGHSMTSLTIQPMRPAALLAVGALLAALFFAGPVRAHDPVLGVDPASVDVTLEPGTSTDVIKTVHTPAILPTLDIYFLAD